MRVMQFKLIFGLCLLLVCFFASLFVYFQNKIDELTKSKLALEESVLNLERKRSSSHKEWKEVNDDEETVIIYNKVPKTASTSFTSLAYDLCQKNNYHVLHINISRNSRVLSLQDQIRFARNVSGWTQKTPGFYHGHIAFLDFSRFGVTRKPVYVNVIRRPLDRMVSYFYFLRYGDDYRPHLKRRKKGNTMTFDECVRDRKPDCDPNHLWIQIPFFCGHAAECWVPGSSWALQQAKFNAVNEYFLVGVTEELEKFINLLEISLPRFFKGANDLFQSGKKSNLRKTMKKFPPSEETIRKIEGSRIWKMENDFYEFILDQFHFIEQKGNTFLPPRYRYEKIKP